MTFGTSWPQELPVDHGSAVKQLKLMGIITRMQILYQIMQWKSHNCIDIESVNSDTKCIAWI